MLNDLMSNLYFIFRLLWERWSSDWIWVMYRTSLTRPSHVLRLTIDSQSQCLAHLSVEQSIHSIPALLYYICKVCVREWGVLIVTDHLEERETHSVHVSLNVHGKILIICTVKSNDCLCCFHGNVLVYNKYEIKIIVIFFWIFFILWHWRLRSALNFYTWYLAISYYLIKKNQNILALKFKNFTISLYRTLHLKR